jgi:hypothetical protein
LGGYALENSSAVDEHLGGINKRLACLEMLHGYPPEAGFIIPYCTLDLVLELGLLVDAILLCKSLVECLDLFAACVELGPVRVPGA